VADTRWKIGRGRRIAKSRRRTPTPATPPDDRSLPDKLDNASMVSERFDQPLDWTNWHGFMSHRLRATAWTMRYWKAGTHFRWRMLKSTLICAAVAASLFALIGILF
jgi:hypothetical protein